METENIRVKTKHIKSGVTIFVSHPVYGIQKYKVISEPYLTKSNFEFFDVLFEDTKKSVSINDCGINEGKSYNYRRTFFEMTHALNWANKMKNDVDFISHHEKHLINIKNRRR